MIKAKCTWKVQGDRPVSDAIVYFEGNENIDLEDAISAENCVQLEAPLEDDVTGNYIVPSCQIFLFCNDSHQMGSVSILSEARVIEVYGYHGEYLSTLKNELMEEVDGMSVFRGDLTLGRPLKECCLKFIPLKSKESMWLYGIKVMVQQTRAEPLSIFPTSMPLKEVEERLQASGTQISEKAEALKKLMELFQGGANRFPGAMFQPSSSGLASLPQTGLASLAHNFPQQEQQPPSSTMSQLFNLLQGSVPPPVQQAPPKHVPKPIAPLESAREASLQHFTNTDSTQQALLTSLVKLLLDKTTRPLQSEVQAQLDVPPKEAEPPLAAQGKNLVLELLDKSGMMNKEMATLLLTEIVEKSGATVQLNQSLGNAEQRSNLPPQTAATREEAGVAGIEHLRQSTEKGVPECSSQEQPLIEPKVEPSKEAASQTDVQDETVPQVPRMDPEEVVGKMFQGLQDQLLELLGHRFEELKLEVVHKLDLKIHEMEERINGRFDAIIDALQGQEEDEEIFEQPDEGSV